MGPDIQMGSREEEPVLQTCDVATDEGNWNATRSSGAATSSFKPDMMSLGSGTHPPPHPTPPDRSRNCHTQRDRGEGPEVLAGADASASAQLLA